MSLTLMEFARLQQDVNRIVERLLKEIKERLEKLEKQ